MGRNYSPFGDYSVLVWSQDGADWVKKACDLAGRNLNLEEWSQIFPGKTYQQTCNDFPYHSTVLASVFEIKSESDSENDYILYSDSVLATNNFNLNNHICWYGSLNGFADIVQKNCEHAVYLYPDSGGIRDSRGLNRAIRGDFKGAIEDFEYFIAWAQTDQGKDQQNLIFDRMEWIDLLKEGKNPFDEAMLNNLKEE